MRKLRAKMVHMAKDLKYKCDHLKAAEEKTELNKERRKARTLEKYFKQIKSEDFKKRNMYMGHSESIPNMKSESQSQSRKEKRQGTNRVHVVAKKLTLEEKQEISKDPIYFLYLKQTELPTREERMEEKKNQVFHNFIEDKSDQIFDRDLWNKEAGFYKTT
jgi:hypothetical protein